ncbi:hypothetical protein [Lederbergia lenta]|uniref:hypothetical protein n=1 Tax=Lederbergia lenta TaxID=1467 RepID=UPI000DBE732A|nr:hypothetical protein [Lederbergia lenta]MEC2323195.1 hypothetical protein [Lederbergia lenta]
MLDWIDSFTLYPMDLRLFRDLQHLFKYQFDAFLLLLAMESVLLAVIEGILADKTILLAASHYFLAIATHLLATSIFDRSAAGVTS